MLLQTAIKDS